MTKPLADTNEPLAPLSNRTLLFWMCSNQAASGVKWYFSFNCFSGGALNNQAPWSAWLLGAINKTSGDPATMAMIRTEQCFILLSRAIRCSEPGKQKDIVFCDQRKHFELFFMMARVCLKDAGPNVSKSGKPIRPELLVLLLRHFS